MMIHPKNVREGKHFQTHSNILKEAQLMASFSYVILFSRTQNLTAEPGVSGRTYRTVTASESVVVQGFCACKAIASAVTGHDSSHTPQCSVCLWAHSE